MSSFDIKDTLRVHLKFNEDPILLTQTGLPLPNLELTKEIPKQDDSGFIGESITSIVEATSTGSQAAVIIASGLNILMSS